MWRRLTGRITIFKFLLILGKGGIEKKKQMGQREKSKKKYIDAKELTIEEPLNFIFTKNKKTG